MDGDEGGRTLAGWLESLDLTQYVQNFREVGIYRLEDCVTLDSDFLNDIGINLLGHRKRILEHLPLINIDKYHEERNRAKSVRTLPANQDSHFTYPSPGKGEVIPEIALPKRSKSEKKDEQYTPLFCCSEKSTSHIPNHTHRSTPEVLPSKCGTPYTGQKSSTNCSHGNREADSHGNSPSSC